MMSETKINSVTKDRSGGDGPLSPQRKQLIVNADDFGMSDGINRGILEAHRRGILTSATLLANGEAFEQAVIIAKSMPRLGVGVHLNLTEGRPLSDPAAVASLLSESGDFFPHPVALLARHIVGRLRSGEIELELRAQIEKVRASGIAITHLDGHKHIHMLPGILPIVVQLAKQHGISGVRWASEHSVKLWPLLKQNRQPSVAIVKQYAQSRALDLIATGTRAKLRNAGLTFPENFYGITQTGFLDQREITAILNTLRPGTNELMCHPGYVDENMPPTLTRLRAERQRELDALTRPETSQLIARLDIHLINYGGLIPS